MFWTRKRWPPRNEGDRFRSLDAVAPMALLVGTRVSDPVTTDLVLQTLVDMRRRRVPCVLVTVVGFKGSTPRKVGAKMLVLKGGVTVGTIGGGALEHSITGEAVTLLGTDKPVLVEKNLTQDLGMSCGGGMTLLMEPQSYSPRLYIFGAGHVAQPLCQVAALAGFEVTIIDARDELASEERFRSAASVLVGEPADVIEDLDFNTADTYVVVVTHSHLIDEQVAACVLSREHRFLGVIGSARKSKLFRSRLGEQGFSSELIEQMQIPVGLDIEAETPAEIAVSVVAQLIEVRRKGR